MTDDDTPPGPVRVDTPPWVLRGLRSAQRKPWTRPVPGEAGQIAGMRREEARDHLGAHGYIVYPANYVPGRPVPVGSAAIIMKGPKHDRRAVAAYACRPLLPCESWLVEKWHKLGYKIVLNVLDRYPDARRHKDELFGEALRGLVEAAVQYDPDYKGGRSFGTVAGILALMRVRTYIGHARVRDYRHPILDDFDHRSGEEFRTTTAATFYPAATPEPAEEIERVEWSRLSSLSTEELVGRLVPDLSERDRSIVAERLLGGGATRRRLAEVAARHHLSKQRVQRICQKFVETARARTEPGAAP